MPDRPSILVPVRVLEGESVPEGVPELLANAHVVLLGYHVIPDQTAPGQARMQFEERATRRLDELRALLEADGATVESRVVFTHDAQKTIDRMTREHGCIAALVPKATAAVDDVLVAVRGTVGVDRLVRAVAGVFAGSDASVTLFHVAEARETDEDAETMLTGLRDRLVDRGVAADRIETRVDRDRDPLPAIERVAESYDVLVLGESDPSLATFVFGMPVDQMAERFLGPVFVVQREPAQDDGGE